MQEHQTFITSVLQAASAMANDSFGKVTGSTKSTDNNRIDGHQEEPSLTHNEVALLGIILGAQPHPCFTSSSCR